MFPRITKVTKAGKSYEYLQIVESVRRDGRTVKHVLANLGRLDRIGDRLDALVQSLARFCRNPLVSSEDISATGCGVWGPILVVRHLWEELGLSEAIRQRCGGRRRQLDPAETSFVLVANRLTQPGSEHGLARWLEHTFVCKRDGRRWQPQWLPPQQVSRRQRVKVASPQLDGWYRTLDALLGAKAGLEQHLYGRVCDLFSLKVDVVFYDLTSTFFQRREPQGTLRRHGHSKDGHPRDVQVVVGVVMANGWPITHFVFPGNTADKATVQPVLSEVTQRFGIGRVLLVADRGMVGQENLDYLKAQGFHYLMGIPGRRSTEAAGVLALLNDKEDAWERIDKDNRVQQIAPGEGKQRYFVVDSRERKEYEQRLREKSMTRARQELEKIREAVDQGRLKDPAKIGARAGRAMAKNHGQRYFNWKTDSRGGFRFSEDPGKMEAELSREGRYILCTEDPQITPQQAVEVYKELATVEDGFRDLKDVIDMRPVWHKTDPRVQAHIFVATLALFLKRTLQHHLEAAGVELTATQALEALKSISVTELDVNGQARQVVSPPGPDGWRVIKALGIRDLRPPQVCCPPSTGH